MKYLPLSLLLLTFIGCVQPGGKISFNNNKEVVNALFEAFNKHDWATVANCYADSTIFLDPALGVDSVYQSQEATIQRYQSLNQRYPDLKAEVKDTYSDRNHVIVEFVATGTHHGKEWKLPQCAVFTLKKGKIIRHNTYYDQP